MFDPLDFHTLSALQLKMLADCLLNEDGSKTQLFINYNISDLEKDRVVKTLKELVKESLIYSSNEEREQQEAKSSLYRMLGIELDEK